MSRSPSQLLAPCTRPPLCPSLSLSRVDRRCLHSGPSDFPSSVLLPPPRVVPAGAARTRSAQPHLQHGPSPLHALIPGRVRLHTAAPASPCSPPRPPLASRRASLTLLPGVHGALSSRPPAPCSVVEGLSALIVRNADELVDKLRQGDAVRRIEDTPTAVTSNRWASSLLPPPPSPHSPFWFNSPPPPRIAHAPLHGLSSPDPRALLV